MVEFESVYSYGKSRRLNHGRFVNWHVATILFKDRLGLTLLLNWNVWGRDQRDLRTLRLGLLPLKEDLAFSNRKHSPITHHSPVYRRSDIYKYKLGSNWSTPAGASRSIHGVSSITNHSEFFRRWGGWKHRSVQSTFRTFLKAGASVPQPIVETHRSFRGMYLGRSSGRGTAVVNLSRLQGVWVLFYSLLYHLVYHNVQSVTFAPPNFHREVLALNWEMATNLKGMWRFVRPFMSFRAVQFLNKTEYVFTRMRLAGVSLALVSDIQYHKRTLHYLKTNGYFTLGLVPISSSRYLVDCALPISNHGPVAQLFFMRFIIRLRREAMARRYNYLLRY
jgi:hypothetical protein